MDFDYFTLLSPEPVKLLHMGGVKSPSLREIARIGYPVYQGYINLFFMNKKSYYALIADETQQYLSSYEKPDREIILQVKKEYEALSKEEKENISFFHILSFDKRLRDSICGALNFFLEENVVYDEEKRAFLTYSPSEAKENSLAESSCHPVGAVTSQNYTLLADIILQRIHVKREDSEKEGGKIKNETASRLLEKMQKGREKQKKKEDRKMELANMISALASHHQSLNMTNIWDLTVFQLYDQFNRQLLEDSYDIQSMNVAAYGNSEGKFDSSMWFSSIS